jgi:hypothetical protein
VRTEHVNRVEHRHLLVSHSFHAGTSVENTFPTSPVVTYASLQASHAFYTYCHQKSLPPISRSYLTLKAEPFTMPVNRSKTVKSQSEAAKKPWEEEMKDLLIADQHLYGPITIPPKGLRPHKRASKAISKGKLSSGHVKRSRNMPLQRYIPKTLPMKYEHNSNVI